MTVEVSESESDGNQESLADSDPDEPDNTESTENS